MSRSNIDKPFFVDVGTSIAAVRCQSNRDVLDRFDHVRMGKAGIEMANNMCDRMNAEVDHFIAAKALQEDAAAEALRSENARLRVIVSGATVAEGNLREEIVRLRELVKGLADVAERFVSCKATECDTLCGVDAKCIHKKTVELVANARKVIGGAE